jgi:glutamyl-tRNA reductase
MIDELAVVRAHARHVPVPGRVRLADRLRACRPEGSVLIETCHRVELYAPRACLEDFIRAEPMAGVELEVGGAVARHAIRVAVGRDSAVVAEDQVLHQLRKGVQDARRRGPLTPGLDRLFDLALRAGRQARSWLPARRPSLADVALDEAMGRGPSRDGPVLVVGAGAMGTLAARAVVAADRPLVLANRTPQRATRLAAELGGTMTGLDPGASELRRFAGVIVALAGPWLLAEASRTALADHGAWIVDLSAPPAVADDVARRLGRRFVSIDDLAHGHDRSRPAALLARLDALVEETVDAYLDWTVRERQREAASVLADRATEARSVELTALFHRIPTLDPVTRAEVERMAERLSDRLLRRPLECLQQDDDGRHDRAARELFGL